MKRIRPNCWRVLGLSFVGLLTLFFSEQVQAQSCDCSEYIYLNETTGGGKVHKYAINPADGSLTEILNAGNAWYPGANSSELPSPHGLGIDLNGFLYIGSQVFNTDARLRKLNCDGEIFDETEFSIPIERGTFNLASIGNTVFANPLENGADTDEIYAYDICTQVETSRACLASGSGGTLDWGFYYDERTGYFYSTEEFSGSVLWRYTIDDFGTGVCVDPWLLPGDGTLVPGEMETPNSTLFGITTDEMGNIYMVANANNAPGRLVKYDANGAFIAESVIDNVEDGSGYYSARGIIYSEDSGMLYVSTTSAVDDCLSLFDTDLNYIGFAVPPNGDLGQGNPNIGLAKAIGILKECCPNNTPQTIDQTFCEATVSEKLYLNEIFPCEGIICGAEWIEGIGNTGMTYDPCEQSITITGTEACGTFTKTGSNIQCGSFSLTYNLDVLVNTAPIISGVSPTCATNNDPAALSIDTPASGSGLVYTWQSSTADCNSGWADIAGAPTDGTAYDPPVLSQETYFRVLINANGNCSSGMCADTSNCVTITPDLSCCTLTIDTNNQSACQGNGTTNNAADDYFTIMVNASASNGGSQYEVVLNANADGTGGTVLGTANYGTMITVGDGTNGATGTFLADGSTTYTITVRDATDNTCHDEFTTTTVDGCSSCPSTIYTVCAGGSNSITLTADAGLTNYQWYNEAGPLAGETNQTLTVTGLTDGLSDGMEEFYYDATDATSCPATLCCPVMVQTEQCCPTISNPTAAQIICDGATIATLEVTTDAMSPDQIDFVYFTAQQALTNMYSGGTSLGVASSSGGTASISNVSFPAAGTYYVYAIVSPTPTDANCRPFEEIVVTVNANPTLSLTVSDTTICTGNDATIWVYNSEIGINYQLRNNTNDSPVGSTVAGTGNAISFALSGLTPSGTYDYNILATTAGTTCFGELADLASVTVQDCDFTISFPECTFPPCHFTSTDIYLGTGVNSESGGNEETQTLDDGASFPNDIRPSTQIQIPVTVYNNTGSTAYLSAWIDWNGDNDFADTGEQIAMETYPFAIYNGTYQASLPTFVPANAVQNQNIRVRFRLSTDAAIQVSPCGIQTCAADGEIEDYLIQVECPPTICLPPTISINRGE